MSCMDIGRSAGRDKCNDGHGKVAGVSVPDYAFSTLTWALAIAVVLALAWRRLSRAWRWIGVAMEVLLVLLMAPVGANALVGLVESQVPPASACGLPAPVVIVVLSGGTDRPPRGSDDVTALDVASVRRLFAAVQLWRVTPGGRLVISGGGWHTPEAVVMANLAMQLGVPGSAIEIEDKSHTTWENALQVAALSPALPRRIWLVSSALHLPRALGAFRAWGFEPCAWSSGSQRVPFTWSLGYFVPQRSALAKVDRAIHELIGEAVYAVLEWKHRRHGSHAETGTPARVAPGSGHAGNG